MGFIRRKRRWKAHGRSTGSSSLLPDGRNPRKVKDFSISVNREEEFVPALEILKLRFRRMNLKWQGGP